MTFAPPPVKWTLSLAVTSTLPFNQRKVREEPEAEQESVTVSLNSTKSVFDADTFTLDTGSVGGTERVTLCTERKFKGYTFLKTLKNTLN